MLKATRSSLVAAATANPVHHKHNEKVLLVRSQVKDGISSLGNMNKIEDSSSQVGLHRNQADELLLEMTTMMSLRVEI